MQTPLVTPWFTMPMAAVTLVLIAGHLMAMHAVKDMPASRKRIRSMNGGLMLVATPMLAIAFSVVTPANPRAFALAWTVSVGLVGMITLLAVLDAINNLRLYRMSRSRLHAEFRAVRRASGQRPS